MKTEKSGEISLTKNRRQVNLSLFFSSLKCITFKVVIENKMMLDNGYWHKHRCLWVFRNNTSLSSIIIKLGQRRALSSQFTSDKGIKHIRHLWFERFVQIYHTELAANRVLEQTPYNFCFTTIQGPAALFLSQIGSQLEKSPLLFRNLERVGRMQQICQ